ncbi:MAG: regulatory protein RecX [Aquificae bacterium]|nr:regulatory protein RecX [Aquificota bacterium]
MNEQVKKEAFKLISKRDYFSGELKRKLLQKGFEEKDIDEVIDFLVKEEYIHDEKLKERYKELAIQKGKSKLALKKKLYQKGIEALELSYEEELQSALNLLNNKYKKEKEFKSILKFLINRGFSYSVAKEASNIYLKD